MAVDHSPARVFLDSRRLKNNSQFAKEFEMENVLGLGPLIMRGADEVVRRNPNLSSDDKAAIKIVSTGVAAAVDPPGTTINLAFRGIKKIATS